jgi:hypothetical protein
MILIGTTEGDIEFDATIREDVSSSNTLTQHPVEYGADISDHNFVNPMRYVFEAGVTNTPINQVDSFGDQGTRAQTAWEVLQKIKNAGQPFTIVSGLERRDNFVIVELTAPRNAGNANALMFRCTVQEVILTESEISLLSPDQLADVVNRQAASNNDRGRVEKEEANKSILATLTDLFFGGSE